MWEADAVAGIGFLLLIWQYIAAETGKEHTESGYTL